MAPGDLGSNGCSDGALGTVVSLGVCSKKIDRNLYARSLKFAVTNAPSEAGFRCGFGFLCEGCMLHWGVFVAGRFGLCWRCCLGR